MRHRPENTPCSECQSRLCSIFGELDDKELQTLDQFKCANVFKRGQNIFYEGAPPTGLFCIKTGKVKIHKIDALGKEQVVRLARDGDVIGYRALISGEQYSAFATTLEESTVCFIPKDVFFTLLEKNNKMSFQLMQVLSRDLKLAENFMSSLSQKPVRERMAEVLLVLKDFYGLKEDGVTLDVALRREDIASMVGTATETVIRFLAEFRDEKMIDLDKRKIKILDHQALVNTARIFD